MCDRQSVHDRQSVRDGQSVCDRLCMRKEGIERKRMIFRIKLVK